MDAMRQHQLNRHAHIVVAITGGWLMALMPMLASADGARVAQKAKPGEIVVTRNVATRPADRSPTAPGMALMVSASPNPQLVNGLTGASGPGEISDAEIASLNAGRITASMPGQNSMQHALNTALGTNIGGNSAGAASSNGVSNTLSAPAGGGAVVDGTRNISDQVSNALSQIPVLGAGH
ncbi:hypothetical protein [Dyella acidisoli]|uniref:ESPR domain-containing protein n=1 Tax=Dyella acidisoli TaxID=1867834 RepID=A0ABQ5XME5_9GAMM|nr:hypothetical protein [Dyella acidisoli]GLQ91746.1 hypothetical protein GCM10007901_06960 [Dyella acidisoli]